MKHTLFLVCAILLGAFSQAYGFTWQTKVSSGIEPKTTISKDVDGISVTYTFPGAARQLDNLYTSSYRISIPGFCENMTPGEPAWLMKWDTFEVPEDNAVSVSVTSKSYKTYSMKLAPARGPLVDSDTTTYSITNVPPIRPVNQWIPAIDVEQGEVQVYRDRNILYVGVYPVSYNPLQGSVRIAETLSYRVAFLGSDNTAGSAVSNRTIDNDLLGNMLSGGLLTNATNTNSTLSNDGIETFDITIGGGNQFFPIDRPVILAIWPEAPWYLIIANSAYKTAVEKFVEWKNKLGFNVKTIYTSNESVSQIKDHIAEFYASKRNFQYLLLFGDESDIPGEYVQVTNKLKCYTDYYYGCLDGDGDMIQDVAVGRLSVATLAQANAVVDKIIAYEDFGNFSAYSSSGGLHCAEFSDYQDRDGYEDRRFVRTSEDILSGMTGLGKSVQRVYYYNPLTTSSSFKPTYWNKGNYSYGELIPAVLRDNNFNWKGGASEVKTIINSGVQYVLHRDHGTMNGWSHPSFSINDIASLSNMRATPIVFSMNCLTGKYQSSASGRTTCFAEAFLRKLQGGCVGIIAASETSYSGFNDVLTMEMFQAIWPKGIFTQSFPGYTPGVSSLAQVRRFGDALNIAKVNLSKRYAASQDYLKYTQLLFQCFGDPGMLIRDAIPTSPNIDITISTDAFNQEVATITSDSKIRVARIYDNDGPVRYMECTSCNILAKDLESSTFYISNDEVPPVNLLTFYQQQSRSSAQSITGTMKEGDNLKVSYKADSNNVTMCLRPLTVSGSIQMVKCAPQESEVNINVESVAKGIYIIEMVCDGNPVATRKITL